MKKLAETYHCLSKLDDTAQKKWMERITSESLPSYFTLTIQAGVDKDIERIARILSFGTKWNEDEILLVLQIRIEIGILSVFLNELYSYRLKFSVNEIDEELRYLAKTKENKHSFEVAIGLMKKNWGIPIDSEWLKLSA